MAKTIIKLFFQFPNFEQDSEEWHKHLSWMVNCIVDVQKKHSKDGGIDDIHISLAEEVDIIEFSSDLGVRLDEVDIDLDQFNLVFD